MASSFPKPPNKRAGGAIYSALLFFCNLHSSLWICKEEGSLDGYGLKMEKTLYQEGGEKRERKEGGKKTFSGMSLSEQAEGIVS